MALRDLSLTSFPPLRFPNWQREYEAALLETDESVLFKRVEVAEAAILTVVMRWSKIPVVRQSEAGLKRP